MNEQSESTRQQRVGALIQKEVADILLRQNSTYAPGAMLSVTKVRMTPDLALAKVYISIFPFDKAADIVKHLKKASATIRYELGQRVKGQLRIIPELVFYNDDSIEYVERIEKLIKE